MFQFHKVRLKDDLMISPQRGTEFQFHKVRLKAERERPGNLHREFQFHKVRLKDRAKSVHGRYKGVSIP